MKKLFLTIIGTLILSLPCLSQQMPQLTKDEKTSAKRYYDAINDRALMLVYGLESCPTGYAKFNFDFSICWGCETVEVLDKKLKDNLYIRIYSSPAEKWYEEHADDMVPPPPPLPSSELLPIGY